MFKNYSTFFIFIFFIFESAFAQSVVDCRVVVSNISACNPYGEKLIHAKEIKRLTGTRKLIIAKTLPVSEKPTVKVISVEDMIEKYLDIEDSLRFKGSKRAPFRVKVVDKPASAEELEEKIKALEGEIEELEEKIEEIEIYEVSPTIEYGTYTVGEGDTLNKIAKKFGLKTKELVALNDLKDKTVIRVGQELRLPFDQKIIDALASAEYKIQEGDTLISIAKKFSLEPKALANFNNIKSYTAISTGKTLKLPLPYVMKAKKKAEEKKKQLAQQRKSGKLDMLKGFGARTLRVTATAYTSHAAQTSGSPFLAAWGTRLRPGMKVIAVSRDMLTSYGMRNGTKVRIAGLPGYYTVRDKMNKRYRKRIDIYMGMDRRAALRWGRRSVVVHW